MMYSRGKIGAWLREDARRAYALLVLAMLVCAGANWYMTREAMRTLAPQIVAYNKAHPVNWLDVGLGALAMFLIMMMLFLVTTLRETRRFEKDIDPGPDDTGGHGGLRTVRLPLSRKVIAIDQFRKTPTDGRIHRELATT
jgi:hypothetical protein